jgi:DNA invertase Pin-like site-specific DNA recombinase
MWLIWEGGNMGRTNGKRGRPEKDIPAERIITVYNNSKDLETAAEQLGTNKVTLLKIMKKKNIPTRKRTWILPEN